MPADKAALWVSLESMANEPDAFRAFAGRVLHAAGCRWCPNPVVIEHLEIKVEFVRALADYLGIWEELDAANEVALRNHTSWHAEQQHSEALTAERRRAREGVGRVPIGSSEEPGSGLPKALHDPACVCEKCNGLPSHLRSFFVEEKI